MKIAIINDWHIGITSPKAIEKKLKELSRQDFDVLINAGDDNGGIYGAKAVLTMTKLVRKYMPDKPYLKVLSNHDIWIKAFLKKKPKSDAYYLAASNKVNCPSLSAYLQNKSELLKTCKDFGVHLLDTDGIYRHPNFPSIAIAGHSLWYANANPPTNDHKFLPMHLEGDTHRHLYRASIDEVTAHLDTLTDTDVIRIFVSHFPIIGDFTEEDKRLGGDLHFGKHLQEFYKIDKFIHGHDHKKFEGPVRYSSGSGYEDPKYLIIDI